MGLQQLVYLCDRRAVAARALLALFNDPGCYVPFAATAINFTQFVLSMLCEGLLDKRIYAHHRGVGGGNGDGGSGLLSSCPACCEALSRTWCRYMSAAALALRAAALARITLSPLVRPLE